MHTLMYVCVCVSLYIMKLGQRESERQRGNDRAKRTKMLKLAESA